MGLIPFEGFCGGTYQLASSLIDCQRAINVLPEQEVKDSKSQVALIGSPGLTNISTSLAGASVRGLWPGNGRLFAQAGNHWYEVPPAGGATITDYGAMAGDPGGAASQYFPSCAYANGQQLLALNTYSNQIYNLTGTGSGSSTSVFNATALEYLDGFYVAIATGASLAGTNPNQISCSNYLDGSTWQSLNYALRTGAADLMTALAVINGQLWILGQKKIEVWYNAGNPSFPFARIQGATIDTGLLSPWSVVKIANTLMWLGADERGYRQVFMAQGFQAQPVTTPSISYLMGALGATKPSIAYAHHEQGHTFYVLTYVDGTNTFGGVGATFAYDLETQQWHERYSFNSASGKLDAHLGLCHASVNLASGGTGVVTSNLMGLRNAPAIAQIGMSTPNENGAAITRIRQAPHVSDRNRWFKYPRLEIHADIGGAAMKLSYSNDGGKTYKILARPDASITGSPGASAGSFPRYVWRQLGRARDRSFQITIVDNGNPIRIAEAYLTANPGTEQ